MLTVLLALTVTLPFELVMRHMVLPVSVNGSKPMSFVLDTGDKYGVIDRDRARELHLPLGAEIPVKGNSGVLAGAFVEEATWAIAGLPGFSQPVKITIPLSDLAHRLGRNFDGIIGTDFIEQFVVEIDYDARVLRLHDRTQFTYTGPGQSIPVRFNHSGHPIFEAEVTPIGHDPLRGEFVLDLGSNIGLMLRTPVVTRLGLPGPKVKKLPSLGGAGAGGQTTGTVARVASVRIGKFALREPIAVFSDDKSGEHASTETLGAFGEEIASRFRIFLDYSHKRIIFEPTKNFDRPFDRAMKGIVVSADGADFKTFRVTDIVPGTAAENSGVRVNDVILDLDGRPARELTLTAILDALERTGVHAMTVRRGAEAIKLQMESRMEL